MVRDVEIVSVFNECPARLASAGISALRDIGFEVRNDAVCTVDGLDVYCLEEEIHGLYETLAGSTGGGGKYASVEAAGQSMN